MDEISPFYRPVEPRNTHELLKWNIFDPLRVEKITEMLSTKKQILWFLKVYIWGIFHVILLSVCVYFLEAAFIAGTDLPNRFPDIFNYRFTAQWQNPGNFSANFRLWIEMVLAGLNHQTLFPLFLFPALGLFTGFFLYWQGKSSSVFPFTWAEGMTFGLVFNLSLGLGAGGRCLFITTALGVMLGLFVGLPFGFLAGMNANYKNMISDSVFVSLGMGLCLASVFALGIGEKAGLEAGLAAGLPISLMTFLSCITGYFRLIFYPFHLVISLFRRCLTDNVFLGDGVIRLPLPSVKRKLMEDAWQKPELAFDFADFLLEYRPFQKKLAFHILHTATAAAWFQSPLTAEILLPPPLVVDTEDDNLLKFLPPANWIEHLENLRRELIHAQTQNHGNLKKEAWNSFHKSLLEFEKLTLLQPDLWKGDYLRAIRQWITESEKRQFCGNR